MVDGVDDFIIIKIPYIGVVEEYRLTHFVLEDGSKRRVTREECEDMQRILEEDEE